MYMQDTTLENHANNCTENFFRTNKCKRVSINVGIELSICEENGNLFPCSVSVPKLF